MAPGAPSSAWEGSCSRRVQAALCVGKMLCAAHGWLHPAVLKSRGAAQDYAPLVLTTGLSPQGCPALCQEPHMSCARAALQAFFDTHEAANAAFEAALQSMGKGSDVGPGPASQAQRAPSAEPSAGKAAAAGAGAGAAGAAGKASPGGNSDAADGAAEAGAHQQQQEQPDVKQEQPPQQAT